MKRTIQIAVVLFALLPGIAKAQWTFDIVSVEAYINATRSSAACCWLVAPWSTATSCCTSTAVKKLGTIKS